MKKFISIFILLTISIYSQNKNQIANQINLANQYQRIGRHEEALKIAKELYKLAPQNSNIFNLYINSLLQLKDYSEAIQTLSSRIENSPQDITAFGMLGATYFAMGKEDSAFTIWNRAIVTLPETEAKYRTISRYAAQSRAFEKAIDYLKSGQKISTNKDGYYFEISNLYLSLMNYSEAVKEYAELLTISPSFIEPVKQNINRYINRPMAAKETITTLKEIVEENDNSTILKLLAEVYTLTNNYSDALEIIIKLDEEAGNNGAIIFNFAENSFHSKDFQASKLGYTQIIEKHKNSPFFIHSQIGFARSELKLLNQQNIKESWKSIIIQDSVNATEYSSVIKIYKLFANERKNNQYYTEANYEIGYLLKNIFRKDSASVSYFERVFSYSPYSMFGYKSKSELIDIEIANGQLNSGIEYYSKLANAKGATVENRTSAKFKYAQMLFWKKEFSKAESALAEVSESVKDNSANNALELQLLISTFKNDSTNLSLLADADLLIKQEKLDSAIIKLKEIFDNNTFILPDIAKYKTAEILVAKERYEEALTVLKEIYENKNSMFWLDKSLFLAAEINNFGKNDLDQAVSLYEKLLDTFPNSIYFAKSRERINLIINKKSKSL